MHWVTALCLLVFGVLPNKTSHAVTLSPCVDNVFEVVETSVNNTVTCGGNLGSGFVVEWRLTLLDDPTVYNYSVGTCVNVSTCSSSLELGYSATRPSESASVMTIDPSVNVAMVRNGRLTCIATHPVQPSQSAYCLLDITSPAQNAFCSVQAMTSGSPWTITGRCNVTRVYSSLNKYRCQWYRKQGSNESIVSMQTTPRTNDVLSTGGTYVNGVCNVTLPWLSVSAVHEYTVVVFPGGHKEAAGSLEIRKPSTNHTCPQYVLEGQNLICNCSGDIGTPPGAFIWLNGSGSAVLTVTNVRRAQRFMNYSCQAVWNGVAVLPYASYTLNVAYGPDDVNGSVTNPFDTNGSLNLVVVCYAYEVNPGVTWMWTRPPNSAVIYHGQSYTFKPQPPADDGSILQCLAQNTISNLTLSYNFTVNLNYPPTTDPVITNNSSRDGKLYHDDIVTFTCAVTGGKPVTSTTVTLTCPGRPSTTGYIGSTEVTSSVTFNPVLDSDHNTQCTCNTRWKQTEWYTRSVQTRLFVYSPPMNTTLTVNARNNVTVNEGETVEIACKTGGRPTPDMRLVKGDTVVRTARGTTTADDRVSWLNKTSPAQCEDTGVYNCAANNSVGAERSADPAMLSVNCKPRLAAMPGGPQTVDYAGQPTHLNFSLVAFPRPDHFTFAYLGPDGLTSAGQNARDLTLTMACFSQQPICNVNCLLTVEDVKTNASFGYYVVRVANSHGSLDLNFRLTGELLPGAAATAEGLNAGGAAAVAVVVTLVVVVVVIGVVMVWLWRRSWVLPCAGTNCGSRANPRTNNASDNGSGGRQDINLHKFTTNKGAPTPAESSSDESHYAGLRTRQFDLSLAYTKLGAPGRVTEDDSANPVYQNVKADNKVYENVQTGQVHQSDKTGPVYQNVSAKNTRTYANFDPKTRKRH